MDGGLGGRANIGLPDTDALIILAADSARAS